MCGLAYTLFATSPAWAQTDSGNTRHPLINRIWDTRMQQPVTRSDLERRLQGARYVLLGEVHDNGAHHRMRRDLIAALIRDGRRPAIAMEQFDREQQPAMDRAIADAPRDAERLRVASGFNDQGWNWPDYAPIVSLALDAGLPLLAANLSRDQAFRVATSNAATVLGTQTAETLGLNKPLPPPAQRKLERVIDDGHCGKAPAKILPGMIAAQTVLPVLGVPVQSRALNGLDSLLSIVQMPGGVHVGTLAIGEAGAKNAGLLAIRILATTRPWLRERLEAFHARQTALVLEDSRL